MKRHFLCFGAILATVLPHPLWAQDVAPEGEELICVAIAHRWSGTPAERENIQREPVPQSFLDQFHAGGCTRFSLLLSSLLDWHIHYGDERSAGAAMRFYEQEFSIRSSPDLVEQLSSTWRAAVVDVQRLFSRAKAQGSSNDEQRMLHDLNERISTLESAKELNHVGGRLSSFNFIANEYTRAAEAFLSRNLLTEARKFHVPEYAAIRFVEAQEKLGPIERYLAQRVSPRFRSDIMDPRLREVTLAVVNAAIEQDETSVMAADTLTRELYRPDGKPYPFPDLFTFNREAWSDGGEVCQADERNSKPEYEDRCEENGFEQYALGYWYNRSRLELIARQHSIVLEPLDRGFSRDGTTPSTVELYMRRAWEDGWQYGETQIAPEAARLLVWSGLSQLAAISEECSADSRDRRAIYAALTSISQAQSIASPSNDPKLYREAAEAYIRVYDAMTACDIDLQESRFERAYLISKSFLETYPALVAVE